MSLNEPEEIVPMDTPNDVVDSSVGETSNKTAFSSVKANMNDSTDFKDMALIRAIEQMLDTKFNKFEQRLNQMEEQNEKVTRDITELVHSRFDDIDLRLPVVHPKNVDVQSGSESDNECLSSKLLSNDFTVAIEQRLSNMSESIDNYEKRRSEDAAKLLEICNKYSNVEAKLQGIEELQHSVPQFSTALPKIDI